MLSKAVARLRDLVNKVRSLPRKITIPALLVILALFSFMGFTAVDRYNYMQDNPEFCRSCHTMEEAWTKWEVSAHRSVNCHDCHHAGMIDGVMLLFKYALARPDDVREHALVQDEACEHCHESGNARWRQVAKTAGHLEHAEKDNIACTKCHAVTVHQFSPPGPICAVCHEDKHIEVDGMAKMHCTTCHNFLAEEEELLPHREDCLGCHLAMADQKVTWPEGAPMQFQCSDCHQPHEQAKPIVNCESCHSDAPSQGLHAGTVHAASACQTCHLPHEWDPKTRETCVTCHTDRVEHNAGTPCAICHMFVGPAFVPESPAPTPTASPGATAEASGPPSVPHSLEGRDQCESCHGATGFKPFPADHAGRTSATCLLCHQASQ